MLISLENVYVDVNEALPLNSPHAESLEHTQVTPLVQPTMPVPQTFTATVPAESSLLNVSSTAQSEGLYPADRQRVEEVVDELRGQLMTIIYGSRRQCESIVANENTITRQSQELEQLRGELNELRVNRTEQLVTITKLQGQVEQTKSTNANLQGQVEQTRATNSNLQGQVSDMRAEVTQLRSLLMPFVRSRLQQNQNIQDVPMEIDFNYGAWPLTQ